MPGEKDPGLVQGNPASARHGKGPIPKFAKDPRMPEDQAKNRKRQDYSKAKNGGFPEAMRPMKGACLEFADREAERPP